MKPEPPDAATDTELHLLTGLVPPSGRRVLRRSEELFHSGERVESLFHIVAGRVRLERLLADGRVVAVHTARAGELVAEAALFSEHYQCSAIAEIATRVDVYDKGALLRRLSSDPRALGELCRALAHELQQARTLLEIRNVRPARERVLRFLDLSPGRGADTHPAEDRPVRLIADELGIATETLYRLLADLEREGLIWRDGRRIAVRRIEETT